MVNMKLQGLINPQTVNVKITCKAEWITSSNRNYALVCDNIEKNTFKTTDNELRKMNVLSKNRIKIENPSSFVRKIVGIRPLYATHLNDSIQFGSIEPNTNKAIEYNLSNIEIYIEDGEKTSMYRRAYPESETFKNFIEKC